MVGIFTITVFSIPTFANENTSGRTGDNGSQAGGYRNIGVVGHKDLDSFQGTIEGVELECSQNSDGKVGFCANPNCGTENRKGEGSSSPHGVFISKEYANFIDKYGYKCVIAIGCKERAAFCGIGGHAKRNAQNGGDTGVPSRHSTGDAMDVSGSLSCYDNSKKKVTVKFTIEGRKENTEGYDTFKKCWDEQVAEAIKQEPNLYQEGRGGCIGCVGSEGKANDGHNDHVHISAPVKRQEPLSDT